jgi:hypothetical protein
MKSELLKSAWLKIDSTAAVTYGMLSMTCFSLATSVIAFSTSDFVIKPEEEDSRF